MLKLCNLVFRTGMGSLAKIPEALEEDKSAGMDDATWKLLNHKAVAHIYIAVSDIKGLTSGLTSGHEAWSKMKSMYES